MEYGALSPKQAREFTEFLKPELREDDNFDEYQYYAAYDDDKGVVALAAIDATEEGAELLSIGVSPKYGNQGIGSMLLANTYAEMQLRYDPLLRIMPLKFSVEDVRRPDDWEGLDHFLMLNGFSRKSTIESSKTTVGDLLKTKDVSYALNKIPDKAIVPFKELPGKVLRIFNNYCVTNRLFPKIDSDDYDPDVSMFYVKDGKVEACILTQKTGDKSFENEWVYLSPDAGDKTVLIKLVAQCLSTAEALYGSDALVSFLPVNEPGKKLYERLAPKRETQFEIRSYERPLTALGTFWRESE